MNTEKARMFKSSLLLVALAFVPVMGGGVYLFFQIKTAGILVFLVGLFGLAYVLLLCPFSITFSRMSISQNALLRKWDVDWRDISRWNIVNFGMKKKTIWFSTGANLYKISPDFFWRNDITILMAYFEKYCGQQAEGNNRLDATFMNFLR